jgi:hypothetical protein
VLEALPLAAVLAVAVAWGMFGERLLVNGPHNKVRASTTSIVIAPSANVIGLDTVPPEYILNLIS